MDVIFSRPDGLVDVPTHYCPGCTHGIIHRMVGESLEELDLVGKAVGVAPVGCSVLAYNYFNSSIRVLNTEMDNFSSDFLNIVKRHLR